MDSTYLPATQSMLSAAGVTHQDLGGLAGFAVGLVEVLGGFGAGLAIALENLFPPLPSEVVLPLTGFAAAQGVMTIPEALVWTTGGSVIGALTLYALGALVGRPRMHAIWARLPLVDAEDLIRTERWFAHHGRRAVFLGRMVPIIRSLVSVPAGVERMSLPLFLLYTAAGSLIWNTVLVMAGYLLGARYRVVATWVGHVSVAVILMVGLAFGAFIIVRLRRRRGRRMETISR